MNGTYSREKNPCKTKKIDRLCRQLLRILLILAVITACKSCTTPDAVYASTDGTLTYVTAVVSYELEGNQKPPKVTTVTLTDEERNLEFDRELEHLKNVETAVYWSEQFEFPITIFDYDADVFVLDSVEIPKTENLTPYGSMFLKSIGLSEENYCVESIEWAGDCYEDQGIICRDALARGKKRIRCVDATYGGTIRTPNTTEYEDVHMDDISETEEQISNKAEVISEPETDNVPEQERNQTTNIFERVWRLIQENLTVVSLSMIFLVLVAVAIRLLFVSGKGNDKEQK